MSNVAIYYKQDEEESTEHAVHRLNQFIQSIETHNVVLGVFIDSFNQSSELMDLLNSPLSEIEVIYMNKPLDNEFDNELINQLSRAEQFQIKLFDET